MKLTISSSERLEISSNSPHHFSDVFSRIFGLILQPFNSKNFSHKRGVNLCSILPSIPAIILMFEKSCLMFLKKEVLRWEQEKIEWMVENDDVAKLI
jgi:hypothetical protein